MKKIIVVITTGILLVLTGTYSFGQVSTYTTDTLVEPFRLPVTYNKTTNIVFPYAIKSVDRGSSDILAQKAKGVDNVLLVKAARKGFDETNLTVITADGNLYSYTLNYDENVSVYNIRVFSPGNMSASVPFSQSNDNEADIKVNAKIIAGKTRTVHQVKGKKYGLRMALNALYIRDDVMYFQIGIQNQSNISYNIDQLRFFVRDQKKARRTASQEIEIKPLYVYNNTSAITGQSKELMVFAMRKFTIPDGKYLIVQMMEKNGGRNLQLKLGNRTLVKTKSLPDLP